VASIVTLVAVTVGSGVAGVIVCTPDPGMSKPIYTPPPRLAASVIAARSVHSAVVPSGSLLPVSHTPGFVPLGASPVLLTTSGVEQVEAVVSWSLAEAVPGQTPAAQENSDVWPSTSVAVAVIARPAGTVPVELNVKGATLFILVVTAIDPM
jgi:hypothetical protein